MSNGSFGLTSPLDLLDKLRYDFKRLKADEGQQAMLYTAWDFFVTAYSLVDWVKNHKGMTRVQADPLYAPRIIKICGDIANGSKHFHLDNPNPTAKTHSAPPAFDPEVFQPNAFQSTWSAWVELNPNEAQEVGVPERCPVLALAEKALAHLRRLTLYHMLSLVVPGGYP
jgi:hypothetical protein